MQLTRHTDYSLRVLMFLALRRDRLTTCSEIADAYRISRNHLVKIVHELAKLGVVHTVRGNAGGMKLARPADEITLGEIVRQMEGMEIVNCTKPSCPILPACTARGILDEARDAFLAVLDAYTVQDLLAQREQRLGQLLGTWQGIAIRGETGQVKVKSA